MVGGGISGLVAARRLASMGADVTVIEGGPRLGGQIRTVEVADRPIDVGAEAMHTGAPQVMGLLEELDLTREVVTASTGQAWIWSERGLRRLPAGVGPAGPTRMRPVLASRILSPRGVARAAMEPVMTRASEPDDEGVGAFLSRRFGHEVTDRLVDPVLGTLHAGDVSKLSLRAVTPQLAASAAARRSLLLGGRKRRRGPRPPSFITLRAGLETLVERLAEQDGVAVRRSTPVESIKASPRGYELSGPTGAIMHADAVVVALPAHAATRALRSVAPAAAAGLEPVRSASVATVVVAYPRRAIEALPLFRDNGLLVPASTGRLLKAAVFLSAKWPHLAHPDHFLVRLSAGRADASVVADLTDAELLARVHAELADATGLASHPVEAHVQRWPRALAQLEVGHLERLGTVRGELGRHHPGIVVAGAPFDGLGIAACVRSGERAAEQLDRFMPGALEVAP